MLASCATIDTHTPPPLGWPQLRVEIVEDPYADKGIESFCGASNPIAYRMGCTVPDFKQGICFVYVRSLHEWLVEHEKMHCAGYDHPDSHAAVKIMNYWKAQGWKPQ